MGNLCDYCKIGCNYESVRKTTTFLKHKKKGGIKINDPDKPKNAVSTKITKIVTIKNGKKTTFEKKIYTLNDGSTEIRQKMYVEDFEWKFC